MNGARQVVHVILIVHIDVAMAVPVRIRNVAARVARKPRLVPKDFIKSSSLNSIQIFQED